MATPQIDVQILVYTDRKELQRQIIIGLEEGYLLNGGVTTGINENENLIFVATMLKDKRQND